MSSQPPIGIDLGTTFSVVAFVDRNGAPQTVLNAEGDLITPSAVFFDAGEAVVGIEAVKAAIYEPQAVARFAKRDMGKPQFHQLLRGRHLPPEVIQALVLQKLKRDAEMKLPRCDQVVITVPAFFNEPRRKATMDAGRLAGLEVLDIINEPTAAAVAFGVQAGFVRRQGQTHQPETILVYDLGGGTFDVTLMRIEGCNYTALATDGDVQLGGIDWDRRIVDLLAEQFREQHGSDPRQHPAALQGLMREADDAKRALSTRQNMTIRFTHQGRQIQTVLSRDQFEALTADLVQRTLFTVQKLLRDARVSQQALTRILLVGGATRMPMITQALEQFAGLRVDRSMSPDETVAHGAALYASFLQQGGSLAERNLAVYNVNSHDLGVLALERETGMQRRRIMIPRNTPLPARSRSRFVTHRANQARVVVQVVEGGDDSGNQATPIGKCLVTGLPPRLPAKTPVVVQFFYAANGRLSVKATLPDAGIEASSTIQRAAGMSETELQEWQQRIAQADYFPRSEPPRQPTPDPAQAKTPPEAAEDEDSEVFSDLDD